MPSHDLEPTRTTTTITHGDANIAFGLATEDSYMECFPEYKQRESINIVTSDTKNKKKRKTPSKTIATDKDMIEVNKVNLSQYREETHTHSHPLSRCCC
jgi:hypothetical protein